jgi:dCMP deaminase
MIERPSFESICMDIARSVSRRSTCIRTNSAGARMQVGCVIASPDFRKIISWGYNGNASGLANTCDSDQPGACGCVHAECNAVVSCDVPRATEKVVFCTHLPCAACAKLLIQVGGVKQVYYDQDYRIRTSVDLFTQVGIPISRLGEAQ